MDDTAKPEPEKAPADAIPRGRAVLTVECAGAGAPLIVRCKRLMKSALRSHGLRVVTVELPDEQTGGTDGR